MRKYSFVIPGLIAALLITAYSPARAQEAAFPLPAPLYILTPQHTVDRIDPADGSLATISPQDQPVFDFAVAPDGVWYVYRTGANSGMVILSSLDGNSGSLLEMDIALPTESSARQTIDWSPDGMGLAYIVPEGVRIARVGAGEYGETLFSVVQGSWVELYWAEPEKLVVSTMDAQTNLLHWENNAWTVKPGLDYPARPQPAILAFLTPQGVTLENYAVVPGTAGALAFDWGPRSPETVAGMSLPYPLYFLADDPAGIAQVWQWPMNNTPVHPITSENAPITAYAVAPDQIQLAYIVGDRLIAAALDGTSRRDLGQIDTGQNAAPHIAWSRDGSQLAYDDSRGVWTVLADGSQPPRIVASSVRSEQAPLDNRVYIWPRWNPDGTRLLVTVGFYEGGVLGVVDPASGAVTDLKTVSAGQGRWTSDGRVLVWASGWGYVTPGLYLLDPAAPDAVPVTVLDSRTPVIDTVLGADSAWYALVGMNPGQGPQFLRVLKSASLTTPFLPLYGSAGGFLDLPQTAAPTPSWDGPVLVAGLRAPTYDDRGTGRGQLAVMAMDSGQTVLADTPGPVWALQWGSPLP